MEIIVSDKNRKVLPVIYPIITSYQPCANLLSVLQNDSRSLNWIYNNFIQIFLEDLSDRMKKDYCNPIIVRYYNYDDCPCLNIQRFSRSYIKEKWDNINDFLIYCIDSGFYVTFYADQFYMPAEPRHYSTLHYMHDTFIYGYDLENKVYSIADFFDGGKYSYAKCSFSDIEQAYNNFVLSEPYWQFDDVIIYSNKSHFEHDIDLRKISALIYDYIHSVDTVARLKLPELTVYNKLKLNYGVNILGTLEDYLKVHLRTPTDFDQRCFYIIIVFQILYS